MRRLTPAGVSTLMVIVVGLLVTAYFAKLMRAEEPRITPATQLPMVEFRNVPITVCALEPGTVVTAAHLETARFRPDALKPEVLLQDRSIVGRTVKERIPPGAVIRSSQLLPPGERPLPSVSRGMRAVSVPFKGDIPLIPATKGNQYVDVYLVPRSDAVNESRSKSGMSVSLTLFRGVRLLATTSSESANGTGGTVTLELTPEQAAVFVLAREKGTIAFSYNPDGKGAAGANLKSSDRAPLDDTLERSTPARTAPFTSEIYKGSVRSTQQFESRPEPETRSATMTDPFASVPSWSRKRPADPAFRKPPTRVAAAIQK
jgi:pilus assembly protein CpaB